MASMTGRERMMVAMGGGQPDRVPVAPDMSNMIPCRLTGKPFWDIYLYQDPPLWQAYNDAVKFFGIDGWQPAAPAEFDFEREWREGQPAWREAIVKRAPDRLYTRQHATVDGHEEWSATCNIYPIDNPPTYWVPLARMGLPEGAPTEWEDVTPRTKEPGLEGYLKCKADMGERGVVGLAVGLPSLPYESDAMLQFFYEPDKIVAQCAAAHENILRRTDEIIKVRPDFLMVGISGFMIYNPEPIFRQLALGTLKEVTARCKRAGILSQIHCCGPEYSLVKISAEETDLSSINPLEIKPMGDCDLARLKREFGNKISLMGNLHTTDVMLRGTAQTVREASRRAIDDAAEGGGFILSTGDQCGRDTPDANIHAMIETVEEYGKYD